MSLMIRWFTRLPNARRGLVPAARTRTRPAGEAGATTTEYALVLALVVVALIGTLSALGATLNEKLQMIIDQISHV